MTDFRSQSAGSDSTVGTVASTASQEGSAVAHHAKDAAADVASTAKEQTRHVARETKHQVGQVVGDVRERVAREADEQARRVSQGIGKIADELSSMAEHSSDDSPAGNALRQVADTGRQAARFLDERGASGLLETTQDFARRKPGAFLIGAVVAGFLVGRVVKSANSSSDARQDQGGRPDAPRHAEPGTQSARPAVVPEPPAYDAPPPPVGAVPGAPGAVVPPVGYPTDGPHAPQAPRHGTPGGGAAHVQP
ncbi:hypothetical protein [Actinosynnema sp. NPDC023587]|uniref:hypothetical protein n=1 Tax=Actinosynnema sp. NPDC023587 TaxID=3154695 RepID=UPI0033DF1F9A